MKKNILLLITFSCCIFAGCAVEGQLSFQDLSRSGGSVLTLLAGMDDFSEGPISGSIPYLGTQMASDIYIADNGLVSLHDEFVTAPQSPGSDFSDADGLDLVVIAPYWSDNDIRMAGLVSYVELEASHPNPVVNATISLVGEFVSNQTMTTFNANWMLLVEWEDCQPFPAGSSDSTDPSIDSDYLASTNTYQLALITDSMSQSYAIFIYECNQISWGGIDPVYARVGLSDGAGTSFIHPMSGNASVLDIDCENGPLTAHNILLDLNTFAPVGQLPISPSASTLGIASTSPSLAVGPVSSSVITVVHVPSSTLSLQVSTSSNLVSSIIIMTQSSVSTASEFSSITPTRFLVESSTVTTRQVTLQSTTIYREVTRKVSFSPSPTNIQNFPILATLPHVIVIPTVIAFLIIIGSLIVIILCLYTYHKKGKFLSGKVMPQRGIEIVGLL